MADCQLQVERSGTQLSRYIYVCPPRYQIKDFTEIKITAATLFYDQVPETSDEQHQLGHKQLVESPTGEIQLARISQCGGKWDSACVFQAAYLWSEVGLKLMVESEPLVADRNYIATIWPVTVLREWSMNHIFPGKKHVQSPTKQDVFRLIAIWPDQLHWHNWEMGMLSHDSFGVSCD